MATGAIEPAAPLHRPARALAWLRTKDAGLGTLRRTARAATVMPSVFAICHVVLGNQTWAVFAAFAAMANLLFVDFMGSMRERVTAQISLVLVGTGLVCLGTLLSNSIVLAVIGIAVVGFLALFAGIVSSVLAGASVSLILSFILPLSLPAPTSQIPDRAEGWLLAGAVAVIAIIVLWPAPAREPLRGAIAAATRKLAARLRAEIDCVGADFDGDRRALVDRLTGEASAAIGGLQRAFFATPFRPTGLGTAQRMLVRIVDQVVWLEAVLERMPLGDGPSPSDPAVCAVKGAAADLLEGAAALLEDSGNPAAIRAALARLHEVTGSMEQSVTAALPAVDAPEALVTALEPSFRAQEMGFATEAVALTADLVAAARRRHWWQQLLGIQPDGAGTALSSVRERAGAHLQRHSVWMHNSLRGAAGLAIAVLIAEEFSLQHGFWVVLGALSVLRSNALNTGQNVLRGMLGTVLGFAVGAVIVKLAGTHLAVYWTLLPIAILFAGMLPAVVGFAAGQAGFTAVLMILFNIVAPTGWTVGLLRVEDVAIGCGVSLVVGLLFWPRGAGPEFGRAAGEALTDAVRYLRASVDYAVSRVGAGSPARPLPDAEQRVAAASARRLDDAFRGYLIERGAKHLHLAEVTTLVSGVAVLRLTAAALLELWGSEPHEATDHGGARAELLGAAGALAAWYEQTARALAGTGSVPEPLADNLDGGGRLLAAVRDDLASPDGDATAVRVIWTADYLDAIRRLQAVISPPARLVAELQQTPPGLGSAAPPARPATA